MSSHWQIRYAANIIRQGGVIAYPTESVYGLGCDPTNLDALSHLLALKQRPYQKGLIMVASRLEQVAPFLEPLSENIQTQIKTAIGQHITWLLPANDNVSELLCGKFPGGVKKVAIRITSFPLIKQLCDNLNSPIISTSANLSGKHMTYSPLQIRLQFKDKLDWILPGQLGQQKTPSEIRDAINGTVIRTKI